MRKGCAHAFFISDREEREVKGVYKNELLGKNMKRLIMADTGYGTVACHHELSDD